MKPLLVGCDPEVFYKDTKGDFVSAHDILPGTKAVPHKVPYGAVQVDGLAAEFNTDPADSAMAFVTNISQVMTSLQGMSKGMTLAIEPFAVFNQEYLDSLPEEVRVLGCNPDYNAWTGQVNPPPVSKDGMYTASGHVHIGWCTQADPMEEYHFLDCCRFVKQLDYYLGLYSLQWDPDNTRRSMYGQAGAMRPKPYGVEYRVLSNQWLKSESLQSWIFSAVQYAAQQLNSNKPSLEDKFGTFAQDCINENRVEWYKTDTGKQVCNYTGMSWPDTKYMKKKKTPKVTVDYFNPLVNPFAPSALED
jgi:hypothetical protein